VTLDNIFGRRFLYVCMIVYIILGFATLTVDAKLAGMLFREDKYFEVVGAISFFIASLFFFLAFRRSSGLKEIWLKRLILLGMAFLFFFAGGEEISWGQRIFDIQEPAKLAGINKQGELNVHNIEISGISIPFERLFDIFWLIFTVLVPFACLLNHPIGQFTGKYIPIPHWGVGLLFILNYGWAKVAKAIYVTTYSYGVIPFVQAVQEIKESNYALLFAFVALYVFLQGRSLAEKASPDTSAR